MKVNMDGLRHTIFHAYNNFFDEIDVEDLTDGQKEKLDDLCCAVGMLFCVYNEDIECFSDLSDLSDSLKRPESF